MGDYLSDLMGIIWIQPNGPNTVTYPLFCHDMGDLDAPLGDVMTALCFGPDRQWSVAHREQGAPTASTTTIETWLPKTRSWLQQQLTRRCPIPFYVHWSECPPDDVFLHYDTGKSIRNGIITAHGESNMVKRMGEEGDTPTMVGESFDINAEPNPPLYWKLVHSRRAIAEAEPLRDIAFCNAARCVSDCGAAQDVCASGIIVADATGTAVADTWFTTDNGVTWTASATDPFVTDEDINSATCFYVDRDTIRHVVQRGTVDAGAAVGEIAYTDDAGATAWTNVNVGAVASEFGMHSGGLFSLDANHIWCCTNLGNVYFSDDAAVTWTDQAAPDQAAGYEELYYIHFIDFNYGWVVGDDQYASSTTDGGEHWTLLATPPGTATDIFTCVATIDPNRAWIGVTTTDPFGELYYTDDAGATWTDRTPRLNLAIPAGGSITHIGDVMFIDDFVGAVVGIWNDTADDFKGTWRTFNGGYDWEFYYDDGDALDTTIEHQGGNAVWVCDINHIFSIGEPSDSTGLIEDLEAAGAAG